MAKAKSKATAPVVEDAQVRLKELIEGVNQLQIKTQIGIKLVLSYNEGEIKPEIKYVDLIELAKQQKENEAIDAKTKIDKSDKYTN